MKTNSLRIFILAIAALVFSAAFTNSAFAQEQGPKIRPEEAFQKLQDAGVKTPDQFLREQQEKEQEEREKKAKDEKDKDKDAVRPGLREEKGTLSIILPPAAANPPVMLSRTKANGAVIPMSNGDSGQGSARQGLPPFILHKSREFAQEGEEVALSLAPLAYRPDTVCGYGRKYEPTTNGGYQLKYFSLSNFGDWGCTQGAFATHRRVFVEQFNSSDVEGPRYIQIVITDGYGRLLQELNTTYNYKRTDQFGRPYYRIEDVLKYYDPYGNLYLVLTGNFPSGQVKVLVGKPGGMTMTLLMHSPGGYFLPIPAVNFGYVSWAVSMDVTVQDCFGNSIGKNDAFVLYNPPPFNSLGAAAGQK